MITLVLGGARSGKSAVAEGLAAATGKPVTYVATAFVGDDKDLAVRIETHRARRPSEWTTVECGQDLESALGNIAGTVLIDSLGTWLAGLATMTTDATALCDAIAKRKDATIIVSDEVGLGVHPSSPEGRAFRDTLGELNQAIAQVADEVLLVVAGRVLTLPAGEH